MSRDLTLTQKTLLAQLESELSQADPLQGKRLLDASLHLLSLSTPAELDDVAALEISVSGLLTLSQARMATLGKVKLSTGPAIDYVRPWRFISAMAKRKLRDPELEDRWMLCPSGEFYTLVRERRAVEAARKMVEHRRRGHLHVRGGGASGLVYHLGIRRPNVSIGSWLGPDAMGSWLGCVVSSPQALPASLASLFKGEAVAKSRRDSRHVCAYGEGGRVLASVFDAEDRWDSARGLCAGLYEFEDNRSLSTWRFQWADRLGCIVSHAGTAGEEVSVFTIVGWST